MRTNTIMSAKDLKAAINESGFSSTSWVHTLLFRFLKTVLDNIMEGDLMLNS